MRLSRLARLPLDFLEFGSLSNVTSIESLLRSPCELLMSRLRLARLDRRRPKAVDETETGRSSRIVGWLMRWPGINMLSLVMVELLDVSEGMS